MNGYDLTERVVKLVAAQQVPDVEGQGWKVFAVCFEYNNIDHVDLLLRNMTLGYHNAHRDAVQAGWYLIKTYDHRDQTVVFYGNHADSLINIGLALELFEDEMETENAI